MAVPHHHLENLLFYGKPRSAPASVVAISTKCDRAERDEERKLDLELYSSAMSLNLVTGRADH